MYKQVISLLALAITAGCIPMYGTRRPDGTIVTAGTDPSRSIAASAQLEQARAAQMAVLAVEAPQARSAMRSQDRASLARYEMITTLRHCFRSGVCGIPPQDLPAVIIEVSRGLAVDEAITVGASQGGGYGYGGGDAWYQMQQQMSQGQSYAVPADLMARSPEILQRLDQVEQRTEAVVRVQRDTSEELAGHLDRNRRSRRER